jgi:hypothetical protein
MTALERRKFRAGHDHALIWRDDERARLYVTPMISKGGGAIGNSERKLTLRLPVSGETIMDALTKVFGAEINGRS